jgi:hypothetical protein
MDIAANRNSCLSRCRDTASRRTRAWYACIFSAADTHARRLTGIDRVDGGGVRDMTDDYLRGLLIGAVCSAAGFLIGTGIVDHLDEPSVKWVEQDGKVCVIYDGELHCRNEAAK